MVLVFGEVTAEEVAHPVEELVHLGLLETREEDFEELVVSELLQRDSDRVQVGLAVHPVHHRARVLFDEAVGVLGHGASIAQVCSCCSMAALGCTIHGETRKVSTGVS